MQALKQRQEEEKNSRGKGCYESRLLVQRFPCGMQGMAGGAGVCLTPPSALDSSEHQPCFCSPPSPTAVTPITHEQRCPKTPGQCSVFPATHTPRDHTPSHIHSPSSPARVGDAVALRAQTLPKSRAGGVPVLGANQPTSLGAQHPTASCPSFLCTHTHTHTHLHSQRHLHTRLPAHKCPCEEPNGFPQLHLHAGNPDTFTAWSSCSARTLPASSGAGSVL